MSRTEKPSKSLQVTIEKQLNVVRLIAVAALYLMERINYKGLNFAGLHVAAVSGVTPEFHQSMTLILLAWSLMTWSLWMVLDSNLYRPFFRYYVGAIDLFALTGVLYLADGPASPLVQVYFILLSLAFLRSDRKFSMVSVISIVASYIAILCIVPARRPETQIEFYKGFLFLLTLGSLYGCYVVSQKRKRE